MSYFVNGLKTLGIVLLLCGGSAGIPVSAETNPPRESASATDSVVAFSKTLTLAWKQSAPDFLSAQGWNREFRWQKSEGRAKNAPTEYAAYLNGKKVWGLEAEQVIVEESAGRVQQIEIMFFNKGDTVSRLSGNSRFMEKRGEKRELAESHWEKYYKRIRAGLSALGKSKPGKLGSMKLRRRVEIWENQGNAFLLDAEENEFVRVYVVPLANLKELTSSRTERAQGNLRENIVRRPTGDVFIDSVPMVDQGQKGYCAPATIERVLRYYGIEELDMHKIAELANTQAGGGTVFTSVVKSLSPILKKNRLKFSTQRLQFSKIKQSIDKGVPLFWGMYTAPAYEARLESNTLARSQASNFAAFAKNLKRMEALEIPQAELRNYGHLCLIIGYNTKTKEICVSNSWGEHAKEQWIRFEDAEAVSQQVPLYLLER